MRTFVLGDIHGGYRALRQCLERSGFSYEEDTLIQLGDITDGYPEVYECVDEPLKIKNLVALKGNHDEWFREFTVTDFHPYYWTYGAKGTLISYLKHSAKEDRFLLPAVDIKPLSMLLISRTGTGRFLTHRNFIISMKIIAAFSTPASGANCRSCSKRKVIITGAVIFGLTQ